MAIRKFGSVGLRRSTTKKKKAKGRIAVFDPQHPMSGSQRHMTRDELYQSLHIKPPVTNLAEYSDTTPLYVGLVTFLVYVAFGCLFYSLSLDWTFIDALYYTTVTLTTVGYGDMNIETDGQKLVTCFFMMVGVGVIGTVLGIVANAIKDKQRQLERRADAVLEDMNIDNDDDEDCMTPVRWSLLFSFISLTSLLLLGTLVMMEAEDLRFIDAFYFSVTTLTTVGYGDLSPQKPGTRLFAVFYLIIGTMVIAKALGDIAAIPMEQHQMKLEKMVLEQYGNELSLEELKELAEGGDNPDFCTRAEFVLGMLVKLRRVAEEDIMVCVQQFEVLDADGSGHLSAADVEKRRSKPPAPAVFQVADGKGSPREGAQELKAAVGAGGASDVIHVDKGIGGAGHEQLSPTLGYANESLPGSPMV